MFEYGWHDLVGNVGVVLIVGVYFALQSGRLAASDLRFSVLNGLGALLILVSLYFEFNLSAFIVELVWLLISIYGLVRRPFTRAPM